MKNLLGRTETALQHSPDRADPGQVWEHRRTGKRVTISDEQDVVSMFITVVAGGELRRLYGAGFYASYTLVREPTMMDETEQGELMPTPKHLVANVIEHGGVVPGNPRATARSIASVYAHSVGVEQGTEAYARIREAIRATLDGLGADPTIEDVQTIVDALPELSSASPASVESTPEVTTEKPTVEKLVRDLAMLSRTASDAPEVLADRVRAVAAKYDIAVE